MAGEGAAAGKKLRFRVVYASGEDPEYPAAELNVHSASTKGWASPRFCEYPQELGFVFNDGTVAISQIQYLSHQSKIASKVELFVGTGGGDYFTTTFRKLGYLSLDRNERTEFKARELKSVYIDATATFFKLVLHKNHTNALNLFNQVAIIALNVTGQPLGGARPQDAGARSSAYAVGRPQVAPHLEELTKDVSIDSETAEALRLVALAKSRATAAEDFEKAKSIKTFELQLQGLAPKIAEMENEKKRAASAEDFDRAHELKQQLARLRGDISYRMQALGVSSAPERASGGLALGGLAGGSGGSGGVHAQGRGAVTRDVFGEHSPTGGGGASSVAAQPSPTARTGGSSASAGVSERTGGGGRGGAGGGPRKTAGEDDGYEDDRKDGSGDDSGRGRRGRRDDGGGAARKPPGGGPRDVDDGRPIRQAPPALAAAAAVAARGDDDRPIRPAPGAIAAAPPAALLSPEAAAATSEERPIRGGNTNDLFKRAVPGEQPDDEVNASTVGGLAVSRKLKPMEGRYEDHVAEGAGAGADEGAGSGGEGNGGADGEPEELSAAVAKGAGDVLDVFGEYDTRCIFSRAWGLREGGISRVEARLSSLEAPPGAILSAVCKVVKRVAANEKIASVYIASTKLLKSALAAPSAKDVRRAEMTTLVDGVMTELVDRLADTNLRCREVSVEVVMAIASNGRIGPAFALQHLLKAFSRKQATGWRPLMHRMELMTKFVGRFGLDNAHGLTMQPLLDFMTENGAHTHSNREVRAAALALTVELYKIVGPTISDSLTELRPQQLKEYQEAFEAADSGAIAVRDGGGASAGGSAAPAPRGPAGKPKEATRVAPAESAAARRERKDEDPPHSVVEAAGAKAPAGAPANDGAAARPPSNKGGKSDVPRHNHVVAHSPAPPPPADGAAEEEPLEQGVCQFCHGTGLGATDEDLDMHFWQDCPMLAPCKACSQVIEIAGYTEHLLQECQHKDDYRECPRCAEAVHLGEYTRHTREESCVLALTGHNKCPLCHQSAGQGDEGWVHHLLDTGCPSNPRRRVK